MFDANQAVRASTATLLRISGHVVVEADVGAVGLTRSAEQPFDLVITDLGMPDMTGWEVARAIKSR